MMSSRKTNSSRSVIPPPIDYIDLTTESPIHRSSQTVNNSGTIRHNLYMEQDEAGLVSTFLNALSATITISPYQTIHRNRDELRSRNRSSARIRTRFRNSNRSRSDSNSRCSNEEQANETIELDDNSLDKNSGPWCMNDTSTVAPTTLTCAICLEELLSRRKPTATRCGHIFCKRCLDKVLLKVKKCPTCQKSITTKSCIRIYF